jgi:hypothetical protein
MKCLTSLFLLFSLALFTVGCAEQPTTAPIDDATTTTPGGPVDEGVVTDEPMVDEPAVVEEPVYTDPAPVEADPAPVTEPAPAEGDVELDTTLDETN